MQILKFPHPSLFIKCKPVTVFKDELKILLDSMWETMQSANGIGLSANQVDLSHSMFVMQGPDQQKLYIVNPEILRKSKVPANLREGCLSSPGDFLILPERSDWVELKYQDHTGLEHKKVFHGIYSVCVQHECLHLLGKVFFNSPTVPKQIRKQLTTKWGIA